MTYSEKERTTANKMRKVIKLQWFKKNWNTTCRVNKLTCRNCEDESNSDTEINDLEDTGCDSCPSWYHLKCTEFAGNIYESTFIEKFACQIYNTQNADYRVGLPDL